MFPPRACAASINLRPPAAAAAAAPSSVITRTLPRGATANPHRGASFARVLAAHFVLDAHCVLAAPSQRSLAHAAPGIPPRSAEHALPLARAAAARPGDALRIAPRPSLSGATGAVSGTSA